MCLQTNSNVIKIQALTLKQGIRCLRVYKQFSVISTDNKITTHTALCQQCHDCFKHESHNTKYKVTN